MSTPFFGRIALVLPTLLAALALGAAAPSPATYHDRADVALRSFLDKYWNSAKSYLNAAYPSDGKLAGYWIYANGWRAVIANAERTRRRSDIARIDDFYRGQNARGWHSDFYDDVNWMVLALVHAFAVTDDRKYLDKARELYAEIEGAWDESCCGDTPAGEMRSNSKAPPTTICVT